MGLPPRPGTGASSSEGSDWVALGDLLRAQHAEVISRLEAQEHRLEQLLHVERPWPSPKLAMMVQDSRDSKEPGGRPASDRHFPFPSDSDKKRAPPQLKIHSSSFLDGSEMVQHGMHSAGTTASPAGRSRKVRWEKTVGGSLFDGFFSMLVCLNAATIGLEVQLEVVYGTANVPYVMRVVNYLLTLLFTLELLTRIGMSGCRSFWHWRRRAWHLFDTFLVVVSISEICFELAASGKSAPAGLATMRLVRIVRITRIVRLLRVARLMRFVRALSVLVHSIMITLKALIWAMLLLTINIYFFAILFTQTVQAHLDEAGPCAPKDTACSDDRQVFVQYWGDLARSMLTLYASVTGGVDWDYVSRPIGVIHWGWSLVFLFFISVTFFAMLNVITGVFCQSAIDGANHDRELLVRNLLEHRQTNIANIKQQFKEMFQRIDASNDGSITMEEFEAHITDDIASGFFVLLDIDSSEAFTLFRLLDENGSNEIDADEFVHGCLKLRGPAKSIDLATLRSEHKRSMQRCTAELRAMQAGFKALAHQVEGLAAAAATATARAPLQVALTTSQGIADEDLSLGWAPPESAPPPSSPPAAPKPRYM